MQRIETDLIKSTERRSSVRLQQHKQYILHRTEHLPGDVGKNCRIKA